MNTKNARRKLVRNRPSAMALEPRVMFDAAVGGELADAARHTFAFPVDRADAALAERLPAPAAAPAQAMPHELMIVDDGVDNWQALVSAARPGLEVVVLDHTRDGLAQIESVLQNHGPLDAIHIFSHGASGELTLGSTNITSANLDSVRAQLAEIGAHLAQGGDILIYGCDVAQGEQGAAFVKQLAQATGADIAASNNVTGASAAGGDWVLEAQTGAIQSPFALADTSGFQGTLTNLAAPSSVTWHDVLIGTNFDPANDQQANSGLDLVGNATNAMLQAAQVSGTDPVYYFRVRLGDKASSIGGIGAYIAMDITGDKVADVFIEANVASNGGTSLHLHTRDTSKAGTGPSNTGWNNSSNDTTVEMTLPLTSSYVAVSSAGTDLDANSQTDSWLTFGFTLSGLKSFSPASGMTATTPIVMYMFTSTSQTANGDVAGVNGSSSSTWSDLGLGTSTTLDSVTTTSFATPTISVSSPTVSEASPYAIFTASLDSPGPAAVTFTPSLASGTATVGTDTGSGIEYYTGSAWASASSGVTIASGATSVLLRTSIVNDSTYEGSETFTLSTGTVTNVSNTTGATGTATIKDDGTSSNVFTSSNTTGTATSGTADNDQASDTTAPTVTSIDRQSPASSVTNADTLTFRVTFSEAVSNVSTGDFSVSG
ncbi:MAG: DUF4347 domain-containing protein, partial [Telluria sp.]